MNRKLIGIIIFLLIVAGAVGFQFIRSTAQVVTLKGLIGGEKTGFLDNPDVKKILKNKYGIILDYAKAGSIEMVKGDVTSYDFLWPSSQTAAEIYKNRGGPLIKSDIIFNSPIVFYSWDIVVDALIKHGYIKESGGAYYVEKVSDLINLIISGAKWSDIELNDLYGKITIISTDPAMSNSGNMFAGLLANLINGDVVDEQSILNVLPSVVTFFKKLGYMEHSSSDLYEQFLRTGVGAKPMIVGYENQAVEFSIAHRDLWPKVKGKIRICYPIPTCWSSHTLLILNKKASMLSQALQDPKIQKLAWEKHGFRTGMIGVQNDPKVLEVTGIPENINQVIPMPSSKVMEMIIDSVAQK